MAKGAKKKAAPKRRSMKDLPIKKAGRDKAASVKGGATTAADAITVKQNIGTYKYADGSVRPVKNQTPG